MFDIVETKKSKRRPRDWAPLLAECETLLESGQVKSQSEAAFSVARRHRTDEVNYETLRGYLSLAQRFHVDTSKSFKATQILNALNALTLNELGRLSTQELSRFSALCVRWADLAESELDKRVKLHSNAANQSKRMPGGWRIAIEAPKPLNTMQVASKQCTVCRRYLPLTDFYGSGDRRHAQCKLCYNDRARELHVNGRIGASRTRRAQGQKEESEIRK